MPKDIRVPVGLTEAQHREVEAEAKRLGLTISAFLRLAAIERLPKERSDG